MESKEIGIFHHAEEQRDRGRSVIPLVGKKAVIEWKEHQGQRAHLGQLAVWFGHGVEHNLGIVTGEVSDLVVVDCDTREEAVWWWRNRPQTPEVVQTGKGFHFYYRYAKTGNRTGVLGRKIDIRGDGGYVVGPGSIHPQTGTPYLKVDTKSVNLDEVPTFDPEWIRDAVRAVANQSGDAVRSVSAYIAKIESVQGQRGSAGLVRAAAKCRDSGLSEAEATIELMRWNLGPTVSPPWQEKELARAITRIYQNGNDKADQVGQVRSKR